MAKLFEKSTFLLVLLGLLVLAKAASATSTLGALGAVGAVGGGLANHAAHAASAHAAGAHGCPCNDKFAEFMNKMALLLRYYASKELGPELQALAVKFVEFFFSHLAAEKPEAMSKLHGFLQNSVQVTGAAVSKVSAI